MDILKIEHPSKIYGQGELAKALIAASFSIIAYKGVNHD